jgi:hypothetical protein
MPDYSALLKDAIVTGRQKREPTKLECGMLGALFASFAIAVAILIWLGTQG